MKTKTLNQQNEWIQNNTKVYELRTALEELYNEVGTIEIISWNNTTHDIAISNITKDGYLSTLALHKIIQAVFKSKFSDITLELVNIYENGENYFNFTCEMKK